MEEQRAKNERRRLRGPELAMNLTDIRGEGLSDEGKDFFGLVIGAGTSSIGVLGGEQASSIMMAAAVKVALDVMKPADVSVWLKRIAAEIDAEVKGGPGRPS